MNRNERRFELRKLAKDVAKIKSGSLPVSEIKAVKHRLKKLQAAGIVPQSKHRPKLHRIADFLKGLAKGKRQVL